MAFLEEVLSSLRKRTKTIRHHVRDLSVERIVERDAGEERQKLEIGCAVSRAPHTAVRLFVWEDRWIWIDARSLRKGEGWAWDFTTEGRLLGTLAARDLIQAFEASIAASSPIADAQSDKLAALWGPLLARGPSPAD